MNTQAVGTQADEGKNERHKHFKYLRLNKLLFKWHTFQDVEN